MPGADESAERRVTVRKVLYRDAGSGFTVLRLDPEEGGGPFVAVGPVGVEPHPGDLLAVSGTFEEHPRFGPRLRLSSCRQRRPATRDGVQRYLASGRVRGIGPELARRLVEHFGERTLEVLEEEPGRVLEVPGVGPRKLAAVREALKEGRAQRETLVLLQGLGLGPGLALELWNRLGSEAASLAASDPYALAGRVPRLGFRTADAMAQSQGLARDAPARIRGGLRHVLLQSVEREGHTCLLQSDLVERTARLLELPEERVRKELAAAAGHGDVLALAPELPGFEPPPEPRIYLPAMAAEEDEAARLLMGLASAPRPPAPPVQGRDTGSLTAEQREAVGLLLREKLALLTGGPGVGKTTVLRAVVRSYAEAGFRVALASPTGRAARRLSASTGFQAHTLHRLFGLVPGVPAAGRRKELSADVLVVDEASMIDLPLLVRVLRGLDPVTVLVLVGDPDQLPSVGPGNVLADLLGCRRFPTARLQRVFRQERGGLIVENAHRIRRGELPVTPSRGEEADFFFVPRPDAVRGAELVLHLFLERIPQRFGLDPRKDIQILSPVHRGPAGVDALNQAVQQALNPGAPEIAHGRRRFLLGDRVMQVRNDHERGLVNGDLGLISGVDPRRGLVTVTFEGREVFYAGPSLEDLETAFAVTVHKAQGGEYPAVVMPLFGEHIMLLKRNVLYTALTRARRLMVIVGTRKALRAAVADDRPLQRRGELCSRLMGRRMRPVAVRGEDGVT